MRIPWLCTAAVALLMAGGIGFAAAQTTPAGGNPPGTTTMPIKTKDFMVTHISTVPANKNEQVQLFVRELDGTPGNAPQRKAVLMLHGRSTPALAGFDLDHGQYSWAGDLAQAGFDVFVMDLQGSGRSPRPTMDDACNANPAQQNLLIPNPLPASCSPVYKFQLNNSQSDWDELNTVIDFIKSQHPDVGKVALIGWSAAAFQIGPYTLQLQQHADKVESVLFNAPVFPPNGRPSAPPMLPVSTPTALYGFPMNINTKTAFERSWNAEQHCPRQREAGMVDVVWDAIMENDAIGRYWGPEEGVMRVRNSYWWGWNSDAVRGDTKFLGTSVPVLIVYGDLDITANTAPDLGLLYFSVPALYNAIRGPSKLMFRVACAGHSMVWERQSKVLRQISRQWIRDKKVYGFTNGSFFVNEDGVYEAMD